MINIEILDKDVVELEVLGKAALIKRAEWGHIVGDISNQEDLQAELNLKAKEIDLENHINNKENPHEVTKAQVGLGNVDNTSDIDKPISTAAQAALDEKVSDVKVNGQSVVTDMVANITVPTTTNELTNNSGFITKSVDDLDNYTTTASLNDALELKANVSRVEVVENDINNLSSNINTLNDSVTELQSSVGSLENDINNLYDKKEDITNKVTTLSAQSTDIQYPSAKVVYDFVTNVEDTKASKEEVEELKQEKADDNAVVHNDDYLILDCNVDEGEE